MRVCRVSLTYPTRSKSGVGLHPYHTSNLVEVPTLVLTRASSDAFLPAKPHVSLNPIGFIQYPFPRNRKNNPVKFFIALLAYGVGQIELFLKSLPAIVRFRPTIVHLQSPHAILIGLFAKGFLRSKLVITFHGSDLRRIKDNRAFLKLLCFADRIFYVATPMRETLRPHFSAAQLVHTPSGIDVEFFASPETTTAKREKIVLAVGNLRWQKDYPNLLQALAILFEKWPEHRAVIIGSGNDEAQLKKLAVVLGISARISFLGQQPREVVREHLCSSEVFVISSVTEGMPKAVIEAMVTSTPVVATSVGALPQILEGAGLVVPPQDSTALADALAQVLSGKVSPDMIARGRETASQYSWSGLADVLRSQFLLLRSGLGS